MNTRDWFTEFSHFYRQLGFFQSYDNITTQEFVNSLINLDCNIHPGLKDIIDDVDYIDHTFEEEEELTFNASNSLNQCLDLRFLGLLDHSRVWWLWRDYEIPLVSYGFITTPPLGTYKKIIQRWSDISRGTFLPQDIQEIPGKTKNNSWLDFILHGQSQSILAKYKNRLWRGETLAVPNLDVLHQLNILIRETGHSFEYYERFLEKDYVPFNATSYVVVLSAAQKQQIEQERGWSF
jgi:hypothetical protein